MNRNKKVDILLTEYEVCLNDVSQLDSDIWQSSYIFLGISIVGFTILLQAQAHNWAEIAVHVIVSAVGISLVIIWMKLCSGWLRLIHVNLYRMREIEEELGMWRERLIYYLEGFEEPREDFNSKYKKRSELLKNLSLEGVIIKGPPETRKILKYVICLIICGWVALIIKQVVFLIFYGG